MAEPVQLPQTRFITDEERKELHALYAEAQALADSNQEPAKEERPPKIAIKHA